MPAIGAGVTVPGLSNVLTELTLGAVSTWLLLSKAKDNAASCAIGPMIRLFDDGFTIDDVRRANVGLTIEGPDGYRLEGSNDMGQISRDPLDLVAQTLSEHHYADGFVLFCGTLVILAHPTGS